MIGGCLIACLILIIVSIPLAIFGYFVENHGKMGGFLSCLTMIALFILIAMVSAAICG